MTLLPSAAHLGPQSSLMPGNAHRWRGMMGSTASLRPLDVHPRYHDVLSGSSRLHGPSAQQQVQAQHVSVQVPQRQDEARRHAAGKADGLDPRESFTRLESVDESGPGEVHSGGLPSTSYSSGDGDIAPTSASGAVAGPRLLHKLAKRAQSSGRLKEALDTAYAGLGLAPDDPALLALAASLESRLGNAQQAASLAQRGLHHEPENVALLTTMAGVERNQRNYHAARDLYRAALAHEPKNALVLQALGCLEADAGNYGAAVSRFQAAAKADPDMVSTYTAWARMEARFGNVDAARSLFQEGSRADGRNVRLLHVSTHACT